MSPIHSLTLNFLWVLYGHFLESIASFEILRSLKVNCEQFWSLRRRAGYDVWIMIVSLISILYHADLGCMWTIMELRVVYLLFKHCVIYSYHIFVELGWQREWFWFGGLLSRFAVNRKSSCKCSVWWMVCRVLSASFYHYSGLCCLPSVTYLPPVFTYLLLVDWALKKMYKND